jgi:thiamine-monophosphate kinase
VKISELGEFAFIRRFAPQFADLLPEGAIGIGDDCAVLPGARPDDPLSLLTTDMLVEDIHFLRARIPPADLGYKSLAVNLSDIAAMGGDPGSAYLSLAIPGDIDVEWLDAFFAGMRELADQTHVPLLGGDTTRSPDRLVINIAVLGQVTRERLKTRSAAQPGDIICVTGDLGDSGGGLRVLLEEGAGGEWGGAGVQDQAAADERQLVAQHHRPRPHLAEGAWLSRRPEVRAMIDVSDGIDSDLERIMESSGCGARVELDRLPCSEALRRVAAGHGWNAAELAATGGEDYCLLLSVAPEGIAELTAEFDGRFGRPLARIGEIMPAETGLSYTEAGRSARRARRGFDHFRGEK